MERVELVIFKAGTESDVRCAVNKWKFQDSMMGEQFVTFTAVSEKPIDWAVGDWCVFRGETFTLNYVPTVTQKARSGEIGNAFTYEGVKFDSRQEELTRCIMLDITPTTGEYIAALGTNYTGSSRFQLFCGETQAIVNGVTVTLTPVCALAAKMQANLDRMFPTLGWHVYVDTTTAYTTSSGNTVLATHTDDKLLAFDNTTVAAALAMVQTDFDLDFCVKGRNIYIGYTLDNLTGETTEEMYAFGYGHGYPTHDDPDTGLFQIKQIANSQQKIVTRLRALGSTKNMPYRYYNKKYDLSQSLFPTNLQLPGTFLPEGDRTDAANADGATKWAQNNARSPYLRAVKGNTNDAYIDKNDDAEGCPEGVREDSARWDGSNSELEEIYPTIEGVTFGELRTGGVEDMDGGTGNSAFQGTSVHPDSERIDNLLAVGYMANGSLVNDANIGDGINPEEDNTFNASVYEAVIGQRSFNYRVSEYGEDLVAYGEESVLFVVNDVAPGSYFMAPTGPSYTSVVFSFQLSSASVSADVGFIIRIKKKVGSTYTQIGEYSSSFTDVSDTSVHEMFLPELPDSKNAPNEQVESITVSEQCNIVVSFIPVLSDISGNNFTLSYRVGRSQLEPNYDYDPEYNWGSVDNATATNSTFHVFIKDMGFDLTATFTGDTPVMAMKSGRCVGREFEIGENVQRSSYNGVNGYLLTLSRATDSNLNTYYPSETDPIAAGDYFVLLGISMPDAYIRAAEARLLAAATDYLADNCETKFTYQPSIDDIFLQREYDNMVKAGTPENSVFWRLYAGLKFMFRGVPSNDEDPLPLIDITIEQVSISMGEGLTPKVDIVLNDDIQQSTIQRLTTAVDRIYNGTAYGSNGGASSGALYELLLTEGRRLFLSRVRDDVASGKITFRDNINVRKAANFGDFLSGWLGSGAQIDNQGKGEFEQVYVRGALHAAELVFNQIRAEEGEAIRSIGHGEILTVDTENCTATLKLEGDEWATIDESDICRGLYNTIDKEYDNSEIEETEDEFGFRTKKGFFASYFYIKHIITNQRGECEFEYGLQDEENGEHPCPMMKFAVYGNFDENKKERQSSMYITAVGIAPRLLFLAGVTDWWIRPYNIKLALGNIEGVSVYEKVDGGYELKTLHGDAGLYVEDNIYLGGVIQEFIAASLDDILAALGQNYTAELLIGSDNIVVDALGNIVDGIYTEYGEEGSRRYKLHTGVTVYDSANKRYLKINTEGGTLADDEFRVYYACDGCTAIRDGADFFITGIDHTNDGLSESTLTDSELEIMRRTHECRLNLYVITANGWQTQLTFPVRLTHLDEAYITFRLDNQHDPIAYRTQTGKYDGLPSQTRIRAFRVSDELDLQSVTVVDRDGIEHTVNSSTPVTWDWTYDDNGVTVNSGLQWTLSLDGTLTLDHKTANTTEVDLPDFKHQFSINAVSKYAGVLYESGPMVYTVQETTDATLYKLLLSANAILKDEGTYTPGSIDVKVQVYSAEGMNVYTEEEVNEDHECGSVRIRYINGTYDPSGTNTLLAECPDFSDVSSCVTVLCIDGSDVLDVQSVTINSKGHDGAGQAYVETNIDQIVIDCDADGDIEAGVVSPVTVRASLYWGTSRCTLTRANCYFSYGNSQLLPSVDTTTNEAYRDYAFTAGNTLVSGRITIHLEGEDGDGIAHTAQKTIAVIANRRGNDGNGDDGQSAFTAFAFKRSVSSLAAEAPRGGSYSQPCPSTPSGWEDAIPVGDAPVWMVSTVFTSDGEYPQPALVNGLVPWGAPRLLNDTYNTDYELTDYENDPGTPSNPATGATWYDPKTTSILPGGLQWSDMVWMAMRQRVIDNTGAPVWDTNWTVVRIKGEKGDPGTTLDSITTWYLLSKRSEGITIPVGNPALNGWSDQRTEPTEEYPFLWRFTRYVYQDDQGNTETVDTALELVAKYSTQDNWNLLDDTSFLSTNMDAWRTFYYKNGNGWSDSNNGGQSYKSRVNGDDAATFNFGIDPLNRKNRHNSYKAIVTGSQTMGTDAYATMLWQTIYSPAAIKKIEPDTWYTLSFWHKGAAISTYTLAIDTNVQVYKDGGQKNVSYEESWGQSDDWKFHTLTFKTRSSFPNDYDMILRWYLYLEKGVEKTARICMPKLEIGQVATDYLASVEEQLPMPLRTVWEAGQQYYSGVVGERYFHLVNCERQWYRCIKSHISSAENKPDAGTSTEYWQLANNIPFLATGLLLADEGVIDLLYSNRINMYNPAGVLTASFNADNMGSQRVYYPSGRLRWELSYDGFWRYYNDNEANTLKWYITGDGDIVKTAQNDDYVTLHMYMLPSGSAYLDSLVEQQQPRPITFNAVQPTAVTAETSFNLTDYYQFQWGGSSQGSSQYHGVIYTNTGSGLTNNVAPDGWYTQNSHSYEISVNGETKYAVTFHKIEDGKITYTFEVTKY